MVPKFGTTTHPSLYVLDELKLIGKLKFDFAEISVETNSPPENFEGNLKNIKDTIKKNNLFATVHAPWNTEFGSTYDQIREGWVALGKNLIDSAKQFDAKKINVHIYTTDDIKNVKIKREIINNHIESFSELVKRGKKNKIEIVVETMPGREQLWEINDIKKIVDSVNNLGVNFDCGHCFIAGGMKYIKNFISTFEDKITHVHLHDNNGKTDEHKQIGLGDINFESIVKNLKRINFDETIVFETFYGRETDKRNAERSRNKIKKLWEK